MKWIGFQNPYLFFVFFLLLIVALFLDTEVLCSFFWGIFSLVLQRKTRAKKPIVRVCENFGCRDLRMHTTQALQQQQKNIRTKKKKNPKSEFDFISIHYYAYTSPSNTLHFPF